jgi:phosphate transport system substrate-binding protein
MNMDSKYIIGIIIAIIVIVGAYLVLSGGNQNTINIAGSTSVQPVAQKLADAYMKEHPNVKITVQGGGSAVGLKSVNDGTAQIGTYSSKLAANDSAGINQYQIANDGIVIIVNKANSKVTAITVDQIKAIFTGNTTNWSKLGGSNANITVITREAGSGTRDAITKLALNGSNITSTAIVQSSTGAVIQAVQGDPNAIGYASLADISGANVTALTVNGVTASADTVSNGKYALVRPFLFLTKGPATGITLDFINWVLSPAGQAIVKQAGAVPIGPTQ